MVGQGPSNGGLAVVRRGILAMAIAHLWRHGTVGCGQWALGEEVWTGLMNSAESYI